MDPTKLIRGDWRRLPFSEAVEINPRRTVAKGTLTPFVDMAALPAETRRVHPRRVKPVGPGGSRFVNGDTLFARITPCTENGKTGLVGCLSTGEVATGSTEFIVLGPRPELTLPAYVYYLAKNPAFRSFAISQMTGTSGRQRVPASVFDDFEVELPPLPEQRKIAAILSSMDDAIEKTQAVIDQARIVKRGLMQKLFTSGLPARHTSFKKTKLGSVPSAWTIRPLADVCSARGQYGANVAKKDFEPDGIRYVRITDIDDDGTLKDDAVGIDARDAEGYLLRPGDILLARSGTVGKSYLHRHIDTVMRHAFAGYLIRFRTIPEILIPWFLKEYLNTRTYWRWVARRQRVQAQPNINATEYGQLPVPCPPLDEQRRIVDVATGFTNAIQTAEADALSRQQLKRALMSVLLTGEVRLTPDANSA